MKPCILITGRSGRIGTKLAEKLASKYVVIGLDKKQPHHLNSDEVFYPVDLSSEENIQKVFAAIREKYGNTLASVVHLAAYYSFTGEHPELYDLITVQGTAKILKALESFQVEQFIFSSTMLVYKPCRTTEKITEKSPVAATWDYPISKIRTEELLLEKHGSISLLLLRIAGVYDDGCHSIPISNQIQRIYEKQLTSKLFPGNLSHGAAFMHMDDLISAIILSIEKRKELPQEAIINLSEDQTLSYDTLQRKISFLLFGKEMTTYRVPKIIAKIGAYIQDKLPLGPQSFIKPWMIDLADNHYSLDVTYAKKLLGWKPLHTLENTLPKMIDDLKKDPAKWYRENNLKGSKT